MVLSLALALVAAAFVGRSVTEVRIARADLQRTQLEYALAGAHLAAAAEVVRSTKSPPYHWSFSTDLGLVDARATPLKESLSLGAASHLDDKALLDLNVANVEALRARIEKAATMDPSTSIASLDSSPLWKSCAGQMISGFGESSVFTFTPPTEPGLGLKTASWHIGEVWRIVITTDAGWRDDRIVRFTGDARHPAATVTRELSRSYKGNTACDAVLKSISDAMSTATP